MILRWTKWLGIASVFALLLGIGMVAHADQPGTMITINQGWQTYRSDSGGFSVSVPTDWVVDEQTRVDGAALTSLTAPDSTSGMTIVVQPNTGSDATEDLPNTRCQPLTVGGQLGTSCTDTRSFSVRIVVPVGNRLYEVFTSERRLDNDLYQSIVQSLSFDQTAAAPGPVSPTTNPPGVPVQYDCAFSTGPGRAKPACPMP